MSDYTGDMDDGHELRMKAGTGAMNALDALDDEALETLYTLIAQSTKMVEQLEANGATTYQAKMFMVSAVIGATFPEGSLA